MTSDATRRGVAADGRTMAALRPTTLILMLLFAAFSAAVPVPQGAADAAGAGAGQETANDNNPFGPSASLPRLPCSACTHLLILVDH